MPSFAGPQASPSTTRRVTISKSFSPTRRISRPTCATISPASAPNMREVLEKFDFDNTISKLDEAGLLFQGA